MIYTQNVYVFDSQSALYASQNTKDKNQIFFYDGQKLPNEPDKCINVPIDDFINYFCTSSHAYPEELNFDNMDFSDEIINQIIKNLTNALSTVKEKRERYLNKVLLEEFSSENVDKSIYTILEYIKINNLIYSEVPFEVVYKLLEATVYTKSKNISLSQETIKIVKELSENSKDFNNNFYNFHIIHVLSLLNNISDDKRYFDYLASFSNLEQLIKDFAIIKILYPEEKLKEYITSLSTSLFNHEFWDKDILKQKHAIFKLYYLTGMYYGRGESYKEIFYTLSKVFLSAIEKKMDELVFYLYTPLAMSYNGVSQTQEELKFFNNTIEKPLENFISDILVPKYKLKQNNNVIDKNKKIKIAFLQERIINYSIYKVFYSLIKSISENPSSKYEFIIYDLNFKEFGGSNSKTIEELKALGVQYIDLHKESVGTNDEFYSIIQKSLKIRRKIIKDKVDILIGMHSRPEYNFLFTTRTAAKQIYWSHGNHMYDIKNIDRRISHYQYLDSPYDFHSFIIPRTLESLNPFVDSNKVKETHSLYSNATTILGSIGRLTKMQSRNYLECINTLLCKYEDSVFLACGTGDNTKIKSILIELNAPMDRFIFTGHIDAHLYGHVIDILLNTFPYEQGEAVAEFIAKAKPVVSLKPSIEQIKSECEEIYSNIEKCPFVNTTTEYIDIASILIEDVGYREEIGQCNLRYMEKIFFNQKSNFVHSLGI
ncbi:hypothetical protein [Sulfurimonas sp.]|uniref:hypothetical protein n=1 Tax=Sulfurimonas sp. TaxID=2022749 RepID=UPI0035616243